MHTREGELGKVNVKSLQDALSDPDKIVIAQVAPAVRVTLGELFGYPPGSPLTGKVGCALKKLGFRKVFDTSLGADIAVVEETMEFQERMKKGGPFPLINSCCSGTVLFLEHAYTELM